MIAVKVLTSLQMTKILTLVAFVNVFINIALNAILMRYMAHVGIALSTSITYFCSAALLIYFMKKHVGSVNTTNLILPLVRIITISFVAGFVIYLLLLLGLKTTIVNILLLGVLGIVIYLILAWVAKVDELKVLGTETYRFGFSRRTSG